MWLYLALGGDLGHGQPGSGVGVGALLALAHLARLPPRLHLLLRAARQDSQRLERTRKQPQPSGEW